MEIYAPVAGTGDLEVDANGEIRVHRHFSLYGNLIVAAGGVIKVDRHIMFDVGKFAPEACPGGPPDLVRPECGCWNGDGLAIYRL